MDPLEKAIRHHLIRYLAGDLSLNELQDWLVNAAWNMEATASPEAVQFAYSLELVLAEYSTGFLTPNELRSDLLEIAEPANTTAKASISTRAVSTSWGGDERRGISSSRSRSRPVRPAGGGRW